MRHPVRFIAITLAIACSLATADERKSRSSDYAKQIRELQATQKQLLDQVRRELATLPEPTEQGSAEQTKQQEDRRRQLLELLAEIEKRINDESGDRTRYVSPKTAEPIIKSYYDMVRRRVEEEGTKNYPREDGKSLYGQVTILLTLSSKGKAESIEVLNSSSQRLADHSVELLKLLEPFEPFPKKLAGQADRLVIPLRFGYTRSEQ